MTGKMTCVLSKVAMALIRLQVAFLESQERIHSASARWSVAGEKAAAQIEREALKLILAAEESCAWVPGARLLCLVFGFSKYAKEKGLLYLKLTTSNRLGWNIGQLNYLKKIPTKCPSYHENTQFFIVYDNPRLLICCSTTTGSELVVFSISWISILLPCSLFFPWSLFLFHCSKKHSRENPHFSFWCVLSW